MRGTARWELSCNCRMGGGGGGGGGWGGGGGGAGGGGVVEGWGGGGGGGGGGGLGVATPTAWLEYLRYAPRWQSRYRNASLCGVVTQRRGRLGC